MGNAIKAEGLNKHYSVKNALGQGSFAKVKRVIRKKDGQEFAVKIIKKANMKSEELDSVHEEVNILGKVKHENIVQLEEMFQTNKKIYMVMELLAGGELFHRIVKKNFFSESEASQSVYPVARALQYLHGMGIVHRDLKPENLIYATPDDDSPLKITDFGLAKFRVRNPHTNAQEQMHTPCGTPGYVAPEVLSRQAYGRAVDMWSLGVILYILLCGFPPFYADTTKELYKMIKRGEYYFEDAYWADISDSAKNLVSNLLTVDPRKRYSADDVLAHPWISGSAAPEKAFSKDHTMRLRMLQAKKVLRRTVRAIIAINKFAKVLGRAINKIEATPMSPEAKTKGKKGRKKK